MWNAAFINVPLNLKLWRVAALSGYLVSREKCVSESSTRTRLLAFYPINLKTSSNSSRIDSELWSRSEKNLGHDICVKGKCQTQNQADMAHAGKKVEW